MSEAKLITDRIQKQRRHTLVSRVSKSLVLKFFDQLTIGRLIVTDGDERYEFGKSDEIKASIEVKDVRFYGKMLTGGSIGAGEAYIEGWWDSNNVTHVVELIAANLPVLDELENKLKWLSYPASRITRWLDKNTKKGSKQNIMAHYDLGNELYSRFLDNTMLYSSAIYPSESSSLLEASLHKLKIICEKLELSADDHLLEIGTGWGGLAVYAAKHYGCRVTTTTISEEQFRFAKQRIEVENLTDRITLLKEDYRDLDGEYDKLVSIEMIEAVGHEYFETYFTQCNRLLKKNGKMLIQSILIDHARYEEYRDNVDFIQKYIFPGGALPSNQIIRKMVDEHTEMKVVDEDYFGYDYARTLEDWRRNFNNHWSEIATFGYDEKFRRLWNYYFHYCEGGFWQDRIDVAHFVMEKNG